MTTQELLEQPFVDWPKLLEQQQGKQEMEQELAALIQRATMLYGYLSHRYNTGCGDQGHAASANRATRMVINVRKAMGFSYPKNTPMKMR